uniref:F-box domain-containing protein n=1 Tax=Quercus lobata TaxID=97700 RepID=A0A7N2M7U6_QUELO
MGIMEIIPKSILMEILSRLTAKEIGNIRIVSKGIKKITRKPEFAAKHAVNGNLAGFFYQWQELLSPDGRYYINHKYKDYYDNEYRLINGEFLGDLEFIPLGLGLEGPDDDVATLSDPCLKFLK